MKTNFNVEPGEVDRIVPHPGRQAEMEAFDSLPRVLRDELNSRSINMSAKDTVDYMNELRAQGMSERLIPRATLAAIRRS